MGPRGARPRGTGPAPRGARQASAGPSLQDCAGLAASGALGQPRSKRQGAWTPCGPGEGLQEPPAPPLRCKCPLFIQCKVCTYEMVSVRLSVRLGEPWAAPGPRQTLRRPGPRAVTGLGGPRAPTLRMPPQPRYRPMRQRPHAVHTVLLRPTASAPCPWIVVTSINYFLWKGDRLLPSLPPLLSSLCSTALSRPQPREGCTAWAGTRWVEKSQASLTFGSHAVPWVLRHQAAEPRGWVSPQLGACECSAHCRGCSAVRACGVGGDRIRAGPGCKDEDSLWGQGRAARRTGSLVG